MDVDGVRSTALLLFVIIFIIFFLYSLAESSLTELPNQRIRGFESAGGIKKQLFKISKKSSKFLAVFFQIRILQTIFVFLVMLSAAEYFYIRFDTGSPVSNPVEIAVNIILVFILSMLIQTVFLYSLPRRIVRGLSPEDNEHLAIFLTPAVLFAMFIFTPTIFLAGMFVKLIAFIFRIKKPETESEVTEEEILMMVDAGSDTGAIEESQAEMISNIFEFSDTPISDIMTHRTDIVGVKSTDTPQKIAEKSAESGFSRLPVYNGSVDKIIGIICVKDLLPLISGDAEEEQAGKRAEEQAKKHAGEQAKKQAEKQSKERAAAEFSRPVLYFPETATAKNVFKKLRDNKMQMAVITDEYGGTAGIVTMEDLLEEIVGSIQDEYDDETEKITKIDEWSYNLDGLADPTDVLTELGLHIPDGDSEESETIGNFDNYDTMSAFLIALSGVLPNDSEKIEAVYDGWKFSATEVNDMRITAIRAEKCPEIGELPEITEDNPPSDEKSD
ncbi:MAG: hemolysin family protein [Ruminococcus sp.]|jgi:putative hemolysin|nr:hemolysin family protein [Ruminococcus sp.]